MINIEPRHRLRYEKETKFCQWQQSLGPHTVPLPPPMLPHAILPPNSSNIKLPHVRYQVIELLHQVQHQEEINQALLRYSLGQQIQQLKDHFRALFELYEDTGICGLQRQIQFLFLEIHLWDHENEKKQQRSLCQQIEIAIQVFKGNIKDSWNPSFEVLFSLFIAAMSQDSGDRDAQYLSGSAYTGAANNLTLFSQSATAQASNSKDHRRQKKDVKIVYHAFPSLLSLVPPLGEMQDVVEAYQSIYRLYERYAAIKEY